MKIDNNTNIALVGMPGAGKSTIGVILAKYTARDFVDTDVLIQLREKKSLQQILNESDYLNLRRVETEVILDLDCHNHIIATGGSAAYSTEAMDHIKKNGIIVFLNAKFEVIEKRISNYDTRGIACKPGLTFMDLFNERYPLYKKHANLVIDCENMTPWQT